MSHYQNLGLPNNASTDDVKKAYRKLAKRYHPDVNKSPDAGAKFIQINQSYEAILSGKGAIPLQTYTHYTKPKPKGKPVNEFDVDGDGKLSKEEWKKMRKNQLEQAARAFYNQHETSVFYKGWLFLFYLYQFIVIAIPTYLTILSFYYINYKAAFFIMAALATFAKLLLDYCGKRRKKHKTYIKIIRKFYDPKFKILGLFPF